MSAAVFNLLFVTAVAVVGLALILRSQLRGARDVAADLSQNSASGAALVTAPDGGRAGGMPSRSFAGEGAVMGLFSREAWARHRLRKKVYVLGAALALLAAKLATQGRAA